MAFGVNNRHLWALMGEVETPDGVHDVIICERPSCGKYSTYAPADILGEYRDGSGYRHKLYSHRALTKKYPNIKWWWEEANNGRKD